MTACSGWSGYPRYDVPAQAAELARGRADASAPDRAITQPWLDTLAAEKARGLKAQLDHLVTVSGLPTVIADIVELATPKPFAPPAAFHMFDQVVSVATEVGTSFISEPARPRPLRGPVRPARRCRTA